jgi:hypothetical protein
MYFGLYYANVQMNFIIYICINSNFIMYANVQMYVFIYIYYKIL